MSILSLELPCSPGGFDFLRSLKKFLSAFHAKIYGYASERKRLARQDSVANNAEYLLDTYGNSILRLAYSYVHNMSDAEDLLQDTLITYLDSAPEFENETHEKAWLLKVTANLSKNKIAYNRLRMTDELDEQLIDEKKISPLSGKPLKIFPTNTGKRFICFITRATRPQRFQRSSGARRVQSAPTSDGHAQN